jgi:putative tryptophan/tyrosine transport system substrate-binding protein
MQLDRLKRREFITLLGGAAVAWPLAASAQKAAMPVVGWLSTTSPGPMANNLAAFRRGLNETGYVEGQNLAIEYRWAEGQFNRQPALVDDLVGRQVAVIVAVFGIGPARAAKAATSTIPIVFAYGGDPVKHGLVASLNRPGGNVTGVTSLTEELAGKRVDMLHALVPQAKTVGYLSGPASSILYEEQKNSILEAARALGLEVVIVECRSDREFEAAFETLAERRAEAFILGTFPFSNLSKVVALAARHKIPAMYPFRGLITAGGLVSYGANFNLYLQAGIYTGRILKGVKPADLPVLQPTKFELIINLKTAKALGLEVPPNLLALADEVIE